VRGITGKNLVFPSLSSVFFAHQQERGQRTREGKVTTEEYYTKEGNIKVVTERGGIRHEKTQGHTLRVNGVGRDVQRDTTRRLGAQKKTPPCQGAKEAPDNFLINGPIQPGGPGPKLTSCVKKTERESISSKKSTGRERERTNQQVCSPCRKRFCRARGTPLKARRQRNSGR